MQKKEYESNNKYTDNERQQLDSRRMWAVLTQWFSNGGLWHCARESVKRFQVHSLKWSWYRMRDDVEMVWILQYIYHSSRLQCRSAKKDYVKLFQGRHPLGGECNNKTHTHQDWEFALRIHVWGWSYAQKLTFDFLIEITETSKVRVCHCLIKFNRAAIGR